MIIQFILLTFTSAIISYLLSPTTIQLAKKFGFIDNAKKRPHPAHTHKGSIPRAGGIPLFLGIFLPIILLFPFDKKIMGILLGSLILVLTGLWDDRRDRSPYIRFVINCIAALCILSAGIYIPYITHPFGGVLHLDQWIVSFTLFGVHYSLFIVSSIVTLLWIVWTTNIVGWSGGVDGQLPGFVAISAFIIGLLSLRFLPLDQTQLQVTYLSFLTAGAYVGFLPWNFYPQKMMPGYGGKTLAGFMLAVLSILSSSKLGTALLVLAVPMIDASWIILHRIFSGVSPVRASSGHLHHHLLKLGWSKKKIALFYWFISALAGIAALTLNSRQKIFVWLLIVVIIIGLILLLNTFKKNSQSNFDKEAEE